MSDGADLLAFQIMAAGLPQPEREYQFCPIRNWRADLAYPSLKLLIEAEGGVFSGGRHTRGKGYTADIEKYNAAVLLGWKVLRFTTAMIENGTALRELEGVLKGGGH